MNLATQITPGAIGIWSLLGVVLVALVRAWPVLNKIKTDAEAGIRGDLLKRIEDLENRHDDCLEENARLRKDMGDLADGLRRQIISYQILIAEHMPALTRSPEIDKMVERLKGEPE